MAFSIRSFFGKEKIAGETPEGATSTAEHPQQASGPNHAAGLTNPFQPTALENPFANSMLFKTASSPETPGQPVSSPFAAAASGPGLTVGDIMSQLPPDVARANGLPPGTPLQLSDEVIDRAVRSGQGALPLFEIYRVCPALFQTHVSPQDPRQVSLPPHKIAQLLPGLKQPEAASPAPATSPFGASPFGQPTAQPAHQAFVPAGSPFSAAPPAAPAQPGFGASPFTAMSAAPATPAPVAEPVLPAATSPFSFAPAAQGNPFAAPAPVEPPAAKPPGMDAGMNPFSIAPTQTAASAPQSMAPSPFSPAPVSPPASAPEQAMSWQQAFGPKTMPPEATTPEAPAAPAFGGFTPATTPGFQPSPFASAVPPPEPAPAAAPSPFAFPPAAIEPTGAPNPFERIQALAKAQEAAAPIMPPMPEATPGAPLGGHPFAQSFEKPSFPTAPSDAERPFTSLPPPKHPFADQSPLQATPPAESPFPAAAAPSPFAMPAMPAMPAPLPVTSFPIPEHAPVAPVAPPVSGETLQMSLASALKQCPAHELGMSADLIPSWVQVKLPLAKVRSQFAAGRVVVSISDVVAGLEPEYRNLFSAARPDLQVELPMNEVFHALPAPAAMVPAPAIEPPAPAAPVALEPLPVDPFIGLPSFPEWKGAPLPSAEVPVPTPAPAAPTPPEAPLYPDFSKPWTPPELAAPVPAAAPVSPFPVHFSLPPKPPEVEDYVPTPLFSPTPAEEPVAENAPAPLPQPRENRDTGLEAFLSQLPAAGSLPEPAPVAASPVAPAFVSPARGPGTIPRGSNSHRQLVMRVLFGVQEELDAAAVVRLAATQTGVTAVVCLADGTVISAAGDHSAEAERFRHQAAQMQSHLAPLIEMTGITDTETFSINSGRHVLTFSQQDSMCLAVMHLAGADEAGLKEKITLIARELAGLLREQA